MRWCSICDGPLLLSLTFVPSPSLQGGLHFEKTSGKVMQVLAMTVVCSMKNQLFVTDMTYRFDCLAWMDQLSTIVVMTKNREIVLSKQHLLLMI
jgi:hypothetical protein